MSATEIEEFDVSVSEIRRNLNFFANLTNHGQSKTSTGSRISATAAPVDPTSGKRKRPCLGLIAAAIGIFCIIASTPAAFAASPYVTCRRLGTDDGLRPIPASLVPAARRLLDLDGMPSVWVRRTTFYRCFQGHVLICALGANLPCGKADIRRHLPAADKWCAAHPGSAIIPLYVTGHNSIYGWRCAGPSAVTIGEPLKVDRRGFIARYWKQVDASW